MSEPTFFKTAAAWRKWLEKNHDKATEKIVGFHKVGSGKTGITYKEALDEALCFGWIDGVAQAARRHGTIRFSPRRQKSIWSQINIKRVDELKAEGRMHPAGVAAYRGARSRAAEPLFVREPQRRLLRRTRSKTFRANKKAWENFSAMPPSYRRPAIWWVVSAKKEETRERRLATLIEDLLAGRQDQAD